MKLADLLLGEPVENWIRTRRNGGQSWRSIREELSQATAGEASVSVQTLVNWCDRVGANGDAAP